MVEGIIQLFFQTIILYIVFGPGITKFGGTPFDLSSLLYQAQIWKSKVFYGLVLTSTVISVGISFSRLLTQGKVPVIQRIVSVKFLKVLLMLILKFIIHSYILAMAVMSLMYKFVSKDSFTLISFIITSTFEFEIISALLECLVAIQGKNFPPKDSVNFFSSNIFPILILILPCFVNWRINITEDFVFNLITKGGTSAK